MKKKDESEDLPSTYIPFPLYILLSLGILVILLGIYLSLTDQAANGIAQPGRFGAGGGGKIQLSGISTIIIGSILTVVSGYLLLTRKSRH